MRRLVLGLAVMGLCAGVLGAQERPPASTPTISAEDSLKLTNLLLQAENLNLRIQALQSELQRTNDAAQKFVTGLQKPGFLLQRNDKGEFVYTPEPPKSEDRKK